MEYFLHLEDDLYHAWRAELLIESFKINKIEDKLLISSSSYDNLRKSNSHFAKNLLMHERKIAIPALEEKDCKELNKAYAIAIAVCEKQIKQPFCVLDINSVFFSDPIIKDCDSTPSFIFSVDPEFVFGELEKNIVNFFNWTKTSKNSLEKAWFPIGDFYIFNSLPDSFFSKTVDYAETLAVRQLVTSSKVWDKTYELSLILSIVSSDAKIYGRHSIVSGISSGPCSTNFITYKEGFPPDFHNSMFKFESKISFGDPIEILSKIKHSPNAKYIANLARRSIERRK